MSPSYTYFFYFGFYLSCFLWFVFICLFLLSFTACFYSNFFTLYFKRLISLPKMFLAQNRLLLTYLSLAHLRVDRFLSCYSFQICLLIIFRKERMFLAQNRLLLTSLFLAHLLVDRFLSCCSFQIGLFITIRKERDVSCAKPASADLPLFSSLTR